MISNPFRKTAPTRDELLAENLALRNALADATRELKLARETQANPPARVAVERSGCALIADRLGINERTVRGTLTSHEKFAKIRAACAERGSVITRDRAFLAWLADNLGSWPR